MRSILVTLGALSALSLTACGEAPSEDSPIAPEINCEDPVQLDSDTALECGQKEEELVDTANEVLIDIEEK